MDLKELGHLLKERRKVLGIPRAELSRRLGVSQSYLWLIEEAKPRGEKQPSQPSKELLEKWIATLGWGEAHRRKVLEIAGHLQDISEEEVTVPLLAMGAFNFPDLSHFEVDVLLDEIRNALLSPELSREQKAEMLRLLKSFVAWLKYDLTVKGTQ